MKAKAQTKYGNVFDAVGRLELRPSDSREAELLSMLAMVFMGGGAIIVEPAGRQPSRVAYSKNEIGVYREE